MRVSQGFGEQGNIGKISKGTREHEPIFREQRNKTLQLEDENMVRKIINRGTKKERCLKTLSVDPVGVLESRTHDLPRHSPVHNQVSNRCAVREL